MPKRKHTAEEILNKLSEAKVIIDSESTVVEAARRIGVSELTFSRWRAEYGGLREDQARRLKQLETENSRLKRAADELSLDHQIPKETTRGNYLKTCCRPQIVILAKLVPVKAGSGNPVPWTYTNRRRRISMVLR